MQSDLKSPIGATFGRIKYLSSDKDRHGNVRWYLRVPGQIKIRLPYGPEDSRFLRHYREAIANPDKFKPRKSRTPRRRKPSDTGYVYFLVTGPTVKIGYSKNPLSRWEDLKIAIADPIAALVAVSGSVRDERALHAEFARHRLEGEWFKMCPQIMSVLAQVAAYGIDRNPYKTSAVVPADEEEIA